MPPDLSVIIVAWRCREWLARCLESIERATEDADRGSQASRGADPREKRERRLAVETIVVDNASGDGTAEVVRERFARVRLISNAENRGFAVANNQALAAASGRHILFLNPDTEVHAGALAAIVRALDGDPTIGACGPLLVNPDGSVQPSVRGEPTLAALFHQYTPMRLLPVLGGAYRRYKMDGFDYGRAADVDSMMGAAMAVPRRVIDQVGPMDERFFVYLEEVDLARRIRAAGYRVRFDPSGRITHAGGVSAAGATSSLLFCRSLFKYICKWHGPAAGLAWVSVLRLMMWIREFGMMVSSAIAAAGLAMIGRRAPAERRRDRAAAAARFVFRDSWRSIFLGRR